MATKIYKSGNIVILQRDGGREQEDHAAQVNIYKATGTERIPEGIDLDDAYVIKGAVMNLQILDVTDLVDENDVAYTEATFKEWYRTNTGFNPASGGSGAPQDPINYKADNYTDLLTVATEPQLNELAHVRESQGTKWLPWSLGGTYYPAGLYYYNGTEWRSDRTNIAEQLYKNTFLKRVRIDNTNAQTILGGVIDSTVEYFLDGSINMGLVSIEIPAGGINISGYGYGISKLYSNEDNYTMFTSPVSGSGGVVFKDFTICVDGTNSKVYDLEDATGFNAIEISNFNYDNCTSLGELTNYRQGLEVNTGRFGGTPELTLSGSWLGGFRITTSIVRSLDDGNYCLFKAGAGFTMDSRFLTDINADLPANVKFTDFTPANFPNPSTLQVSGALITRNGSSNPSDTNIFPNISHVDKEAVFRDNQGIQNTFEGGRLSITAEATTVISTVGEFYAIAGTWSSSDLQHFDSPANGQLRHLGNNPREYQVNADLVVDGDPNAEIEIRLRVYDASLGTTSTVFTQRRQVNSLVGGRDVAFFNIHAKAELDINDYAFLELANNTNTVNVTVEIDSYFDLEKR